MPLRLRAFDMSAAGTVAGWAESGPETLRWCGRDAAVSGDVVAGWASEDGVQPYGLYHDDRLVGYGEAWVDDEASEVELARLIIDPTERGHGLGRRLVAELTAVALRHYPSVFMRVHPDNTSALRCYASVDFVPVEAALAAEWNRPQPVAYVWLTLGPRRVGATRIVGVPVAAIFDLVSDPDGHVRLDGSGMLVAAAAPGRLTAVGDVFEMEMDREPLGDLPMGRYRTRNVVTRIESGHLLEWAVGYPDGRLLGHVYGYVLQPVSEAETEVTSYCDWSAVAPAVRARMTWPVVPVDRLERSLLNLEALLTESGDRRSDSSTTPAPGQHVRQPPSSDNA
jgi:GNAT superfamily N-acetyltransferase